MLVPTSLAAQISLQPHVGRIDVSLSSEHFWRGHGNRRPEITFAVQGSWWKGRAEGKLSAEDEHSTYFSLGLWAMALPLRLRNPNARASHPPLESELDMWWQVGGKLGSRWQVAAGGVFYHRTYGDEIAPADSAAASDFVEAFARLGLEFSWVTVEGTAFLSSTSFPKRLYLEFAKITFHPSSMGNRLHFGGALGGGFEPDAVDRPRLYSQNLAYADFFFESTWTFSTVAYTVSGHANLGLDDFTDKRVWISITLSHVF